MAKIRSVRVSKKKRNKIKRRKPNLPKGKSYTVNPPPGFSVKLAANFGTEEPFVVRIQIQTKEILKFIDMPNNDEIDFRFDRIVEQLDIARIHLGRIEDKGFHNKPTFDQQAEYVAFYNSVWWAYKDRFQLFIKELGFDIGFIFQDEKNFEKGAKRFIEKHPNTAGFVEVARNDRKLWQNHLALHRNVLHSGDRRNEKHDSDNPADARMIFDNVWRAIEEYLAYLVEKVMADGWTLVHIPEEQRDNTIPIRFKPYPKGLLDGTIKLPSSDSNTKKSTDQIT